MIIKDRRQHAMGGDTKDRHPSQIKKIAIHWDAVGKNGNTILQHERYWKNSRGWTNGGYAFFVERNGVIHQNYSLEKITNGVKGHNTTTLHICYSGAPGKPITTQQRKAITQLIQQLMSKELSHLKVRDVLGHKEFKGASTTCPGNGADIIRAELNKETSKPEQTAVYVVKKGDTLGEIAKEFNTTAEILAKRNNIKNPNLIQIGQVIKLDGKPSYTVKPGDSMYKIAKENGLTTKGLLAKNPQVKGPGYIIHPGDKINL